EGDGGDHWLHVAPSAFAYSTINALVEIDVPEGGGPFPLDVPLRKGRALTAKVVGPDGEPLAGARYAGWGPYSNWSSPMAKATLRLEAAPPRGHRFVLFRHEDRGLVGALSLDLAQADEKPLTVALRPWGI